MTTLDDLKLLRNQLNADRDAVDQRIAALDRIIARLESSSPAASSELFPTTGGVLVVSTGARPVSAEIRDAMEYTMLDKQGLDFEVKDVVREIDFIKSLSKSKATQGNLSRIWENNIARFVAHADPAAVDIEHIGVSLRIAEGRDDTYAMTTVTLANSKKNDVALLHVLINKKNGRALLVGDTAVTEKTRATLQSNGITYVSRADANARKDVITALALLVDAPKVKGRDAFMGERLLEAFNYRVGTAQGGSYDTLVEGLVARDAESLYDKYVVKTSSSRGPAVKN